MAFPLSHPDGPSRFPLCESAGAASIVSEATSRTRDRDTDQHAIEEWVAEIGSLPGLTVTQVIMSREAAALAVTVRELLGKRLSIRARRRWQGRAWALLRRTA